MNNKQLKLPKKRLMIVIGSLMVGGTETFLVRVLSKLIERDWYIEVFTLAYQPGELAPTLRDRGVIVTPIVTEQDYKKLSQLPRVLERLCRIFLCITRLSKRLKQENHLKQKNTLLAESTVAETTEELYKENRLKNSTPALPTILHFYLPEAYVLGMISALIARFTGPKGMSRRSLNHYQKKRPWVTWLEKKLHRYLDFATGNSRPVIEQLQEEGIPNQKIKLIYNGIDTSKTDTSKTNTSNIITSQPPIRESLNIENHELVFVIVANLIPYKGHEDLLHAFSLIKDKIQDPWKLICIGRNQGILEHLQNLTRSYNIDKNVLWLGERKDVPELLQCSDVGLLTSHEEGFSNAILECMAAGLPMVVTDVGGNAEAVLHGKTGYVVPAKNPEALSQAILQLTADKIQIKEFGNVARQRVLSHFSLENCVSEHEVLYKSLKTFN